MSSVNFPREAEGLRSQFIVLMILVLALVLRSCSSDVENSQQHEGSLPVPSQSLNTGKISDSPVIEEES